MCDRNLSCHGCALREKLGYDYELDTEWERKSFVPHLFANEAAMSDESKNEWQRATDILNSVCDRRNLMVNAGYNKVTFLDRG